MEKMNSKKVGKVIGVALVVFLLAMVMQSCVVSAQDDPIDIYSVELNGVEKHTEVRPGEAVTVTVSYSLNTHVVTREDKSNVVVGFEHEAKICLIGETEWDTVTFDGWYHFKKIFGINAPTKPGTYYIYEVTTVGRTCEEMKALYPNCFGLQQIADFEVIGSNEPDEPDKDGYAKVQSVDLNGLDYSVMVEPGETIAVEIFFGYVAPTSPLPEDKVEIVIAFEGAPIGCLIGEIGQAEHLDGHDYLRTFSIIAPTEPGLYHIMRTRTKGYTCDGAKKLYRDYPSTRKVIGEIDVIADDEPDEDDKWTLLHQSNITLTSLFGDPPYTIAFLQRKNNDLRVQIQTPGFQEVETGKVFISVDEDVFVKYDTGRVYESIVGVEDSDFIELKPGASGSRETQKAFFDLVMEFVPYSGMFASTINLGTAIYNDTSDEFEVDEDLDLAKIAEAYYPHEYFTTNTFQNERDVVTIPWALDIFNGREAIRVDCPEMTFPSKGTHTVVFCVVVNVHNVNVRHTIALPIEIEKQKMEA